MDVPAATWLTYRDAAERLKVTPAMVADAARRMKWPSRLQNDDTAEVEVPGEVLAEAETGAGGTTSQTPLAIDASTLEAALKAAMQPLQAVIDALLENAQQAVRRSKCCSWSGPPPKPTRPDCEKKRPSTSRESPI